MGTPDTAPSSPAVTPLKPGDRVEYRNSRGYVRYVGPVDGHEGTWIGVDWDSASRGRHDGIVGGKQYFQTTYATSGSFVRATKIGSGSRRSLQDVIRERVRAERELVNSEQQGVSSSSVGWTIGNKEVHVAFETRASWKDDDVRSLDVSEMGVCGFEGNGIAGCDESVGVRLDSLSSLRVAESLIAEWQFVHTLVEQLPGLTYLDVSRNKFDRFDWNRNMDGVTSGLKELALNGCNVQLEGVLALCERCPKLTQLRLFNTGLDSLRNSGKFDMVKVLPCVRLIDLGGNKLPWTDIQQVVGRMTQLEELFLADNDIGLHGEQLDEDGLFPSLHRLSLGENPISDWPLITSLVRVPSLRSLLIADTPLTKDEEDWDPVKNQFKSLDSSAIASRHGIIARLGQLQKLHASVIDGDERMYAEKRYLTTECLPSLERCKTPAEAEKLHPRMRELCKMYEVDLDNVVKDAAVSTAVRRGATLRADLVNVLFKAGANVTATRQEVYKELPRCVHGGKLTALARKFLGIKTRTGLTLTMEHNRRNSIVSKDNNTLAQLHVKPGDDVVITVE